jgi:hypothetical protein
MKMLGALLSVVALGVMAGYAATAQSTVTITLVRWPFT